jgi:ABC-type maltose transport system permease subunit
MGRIEILNTWRLKDFFESLKREFENTTVSKGYSGRSPR